MRDKLLKISALALLPLLFMGMAVTKIDEGSNKSKSVVSAANSVGIDMVLVQGGKFTMGSNGGYPNEKPEHDVTVSDFYLSKYEVTQEQWEKVMGSNPSKFKGGDRPVENVSWEDAQAFVKKLNEMEGTSKYRLPSEAEWEYAARGGKKGKGHLVAGSENVLDVAWFNKNSGKQTKSVGKKRPNEIGLYDMSGNVWEWVNDWFNDKYYAESASANPQGPAQGTFKAIRGGSCYDGPNSMRVSGRFSSLPQVKSSIIGFRLAASK